MKNQNIDDLFEYAQRKFIHLWLLTENLSKMIEKEIGVLEQIAAENKKNLDDSHNSCDNNFKGEEKLSFKEFKKLLEENPDRARAVFRSWGYEMALTMASGTARLYHSVFPNMIWSSILAITLAHFENSLKRISDSLGKQMDCKVAIADLQGLSILEKCKKFLTKIIEIDLDFGSSGHWNAIMNHQKVRNLVVHNGGYIDDSGLSEQIKDFILDKKNKLSLDNDNMIIFTKDYVLTVLEISSSFLSELEKALTKSASNENLEQLYRFDG